MGEYKGWRVREDKGRGTWRALWINFRVGQC